MSCLLPLLVSFPKGARESAINKAEGVRQSKILTSEADKIQQINQAQGQLCIMTVNIYKDTYIHMYVRTSVYVHIWH